MFSAGVPFGVNISFGYPSHEVTLSRALIGYVVVTQFSAAFPSAYAVITGHSVYDKTVSCQISIYTSEQSKLNNDQPIDYDTQSFPVDYLQASVDIMTALYQVILTVSKYSACNLI